MVALNQNNLAALDKVFKANFDFTVEKRQLRDEHGNLSPHFGLYRSDNNACVGNSVRAGYEVHTNEDVYAQAEAAVKSFDGVPMVISARWNDGHRIVIGPTNDYIASVSDGDTIFPRFMLSAGYGNIRYRQSSGLFRSLCTNLSMIRAAGENINVSMRHTRQLRDSMPMMIDRFQGALRNWGETLAIAEKMKATEINFQPYAEEVFGIDLAKLEGRAIQNWNDRYEAMVARIINERMTLRGDAGNLEQVSAWTAFNAVQGYVQHGQRRRGNPDRLDRALLALDSPIVERARDLALTLAS